MRKGIFDGWPSGHATTAVSIAASLSEIYPESRESHVVWYGVAAYVAFGVSTNIHWLSDSVAGALVGYSIGKTVGKSYYRRMKQSNLDKPVTSVYPFIVPDYVGLTWQRQF
jgi:membrane-associated phospholipid phosphatase